MFTDTCSTVNKRYDYRYDCSTGCPKHNTGNVCASATESVVNKISKREKDRSKTTLSLMNAMLTAAVAVKSGCEMIPTWSAVVAGLGSAPLYYASTLQFKKYDFIFLCITAIQRLQALKKNLVRILLISS